MYFGKQGVSLVTVLLFMLVATIAATANASTSGSYYKFCGSTVATTLTDGYALNSTGSTFVNFTSSQTIPAFRAWFTAASISSLTLPALSIGNSQMTGIEEVTVNGESAGRDCWYTIDGRRLNSKPTTRGLYINNGKKIFVN